MATHSSILAWRTPWTEEPGGLQSMVSQRVGYDLATEHACTHATHTHTHTHTHTRIYSFYILFHYGLLQDTEYIGISLCHTIGHCCLSISMYNSLHLLVPNSQFIPPFPTLPSLATTSLFSMSVSGL